MDGPTVRCVGSVIAIWMLQLVILVLSFVFSMVISGDKLAALTSQHASKRKQMESADVEIPGKSQTSSVAAEDVAARVGEEDGEGIDDW